MIIKTTGTVKGGKHKSISLTYIRTYLIYANVFTYLMYRSNVSKLLTCKKTKAPKWAFF